MKHLMKRAFVLLLSASIVFSSVPVQHVHAEEGDAIVANEQEGEIPNDTVQEQLDDETTQQSVSELAVEPVAITSGNWYYNANNDGTISFSTYNGEYGEDVDLVIPDTYDGKTVTGWSYQIFKDKSFKSVTLPTTLTTEASLFGDCGVIEKVIVPENYTTMKPWFYGIGEGKIKSIEFENAAITEIPNNAFYGLKTVESITGLENVVTVGEGAFNACESLTSINFSDKLTSIGQRAFQSATSLTAAYMGGTITTIPNSAFFGCTNLESVTGVQNVTKVEGKAFYNCTQLGNVTLSGNLGQLGESSFYGTAITSFDIPAMPKDMLGHSVFTNCTQLVDVTIADGVTGIPNNMFSQCTSLDSVQLPESIVKIGSGAFSGCTALEYINFPDTITSFGNTFLSGCSSLTSLTLPGSLGVVANMSGCKGLKQVVLKDGICEISAYCFYGIPLETIQIPATVVTIGDGALGWYDREAGVTKYPIIYGYTGSYAETYAKEKGIAFESIGVIESEQLGVFLSAAEMFTDQNGAITIIRGMGNLSAQAQLGTSAQCTGWGFNYIAPDGTISPVGTDYYESNEKTNELIVLDTSEFSTDGSYQIIAYGKDAEGTEVSYTVEFSFENIEMSLEPLTISLYDGSKETVRVVGNYIPPNVEFHWAVGEYDDDGNFVTELELDSNEDGSCTITEDKLESVWGENPADESKTCLRVSMVKGDVEIDYTLAEVTYCEDVIEFPYENLVELKGRCWEFGEDQQIYIRNAANPDGTYIDIKITSIESDTMSFPYDAEIGYFEFAYANATADSGKMTFTYTMYDANGILVENKFDTEYKFKDAMYYLETVTTGAQAWMVKGQTKNIKPVVYKNWLVEDEDGYYEVHWDEVQIKAPLTAQWIYDKKEAAKYLTIQENSDGSLNVKAINGVDSEIYIPLQLIIKDGDEIVASTDERIALTTEYDQFFVYDVSTGKPFAEDSFKLGEARILRPVAMKFDNETPNGTDLEVAFSAENAGLERAFEITDNNNGTYTIKRMSDDPMAICFKGQFLGWHIDETLYFPDLEGNIEFVTDDNETIVLFADDKIDVTASTDEVTDDVVWEWDLVVYGKSGAYDDDELYRVNIASGKNLRSIELDGSKYAEYLEDRRVNDFKIEIRLRVDNRLAIIDDTYIEYKKSHIETPIEGVWEQLLTTVCGIEKTYQGRIETKDYPNGINAQLEIRNLQILSGKDVVSMENESEYYTFTIVKEGTAVINYDVYYNNKLVKEDIVLEIKGTKALYEGNIVSDKSDNGGALIFKNESITFAADYNLHCYSEEGYFYKENVEDLRLTVANAYYMCNEDECEGSCEDIVEISENQDGTVTYAPNGHDCNVELELDVYAGDVKIDTITEWAFVTRVDYRIVVENAAEIKELKPGESVEFRPVLKRFSADALDGTVVDTSEYDFIWEYDKDDFEITSKDEDGITVWTIKRISSYATSLYCAYVDSKWDDTFAGWLEGFDCEHGNTKRINGKDATCLESGYSGAKVCEDCEYLVETSSPIDRLPHTMTYHEAVEATCEKAGNVEYWYCSSCQKNYNAEQEGTLITDVVVDKKAHEMTHYEAVEATCTETGTVEYWYCETCDKNYDKEAGGNVIADVVVVKPHSIEHCAAKTATCTENGNVEYWYCSACEKNFEDATGKTEFTTDVLITSEGHKMTKTDRVEATCTKAGNEEYYTCEVCELVFADEAGNEKLSGIVKPATGHKMTYHVAETATCMEAGNIEYYECSACEKNFEDATGKTELAIVTVDATGHKMKKHAAKAATCEEDGNKEYFTCFSCNKNFADAAGETELSDIVLDANGHTPGADATCATAKVCTVCDKVLEEAKGHIMKKVDSKEASCTGNGTVEYYHCTVEGCNKNFADEAGNYELFDTTINAAGHRLSKVDATDATCIADGNIEYYTCSACEKNYEDAEAIKEITISVVIKSQGHVMTKTDAKAKTCTTDGNVEYYTCSACDKYFADAAGSKELAEDKLVIKADHGILKRTKRVEATCTVDGNVEYYTCSDCGKYYSDRTAKTELTEAALVIKAKHIINEESKHAAVEATCTEAGNVEYYACSVCSKNFADKTGNTLLATVVVAAKGHKDMIRHDVARPSCTGTGNVEYYECNECHKYFEDENGGKVLDKVSTEATGHKLSLVNAKAATCTADGNVKYYHCTVEGCEKNFQDAECTRELTELVVKALGHKIGEDPTPEVAATCTTTGTKAYYTCENCQLHFADANGQNVLDSIVTPIKHKLEYKEGKEPKQGEEGRVAHYACSVEGCGKKFADAEGMKPVENVDLPGLVTIKSEPLTEIPENLNKDAMGSEGFRHVEEIKEEILSSTEEKLVVSENETIETTHFEFTLETESEMPLDQKITIFWAYSEIGESVGKDTEFVVAHMYKTCDENGNEVTDIEFPEVHNDDDGIWFVVHGLSPISVSWVETETSDSGNATPPSSGSGTGAGSSSSSDKEEAEDKKEESKPTLIETAPAPQQSTKTETATTTSSTSSSTTASDSTQTEEVEAALPAMPENADTTVVEIVASEEVVEAVKETVVVNEGTANIDENAMEAVVEATADEEPVILPLTQVSEETVEKAVVDTKALETVAEAKKDVVIEFSDMTVKFDAKALKAITDQADGGTIEIRAVKAEEQHLSEDQKKGLDKKDVAAVVSVQIFSDGEYIGNFKGGKVTVKIPFQPEEGREGKHHKVYYVDDYGKTKKVPSDFVEGHMVFTTSHFSDYVIVYEAAEAAEDVQAEDVVMEEVPVEDGNEEEKASFPVIPVIAVAAIIAVAATVLVLKKRKTEE